MSTKQTPWFHPTGRHTITGHVVRPDPRLIGLTFWRWAYRSIMDIAVVEASFGKGSVYYTPRVALWKKQERYRATGCLVLKIDDEYGSGTPQFCLCHGVWNLQDRSIDEMRAQVAQPGSIRMVFCEPNSADGLPQRCIKVCLISQAA